MPDDEHFDLTSRRSQIDMRAPDFLRRFAVPGRPGQELVYAEVLDADGPVGWARFAFCDPIVGRAFREQMLYPDHHVAVAVLFRDDQSPLPPEAPFVDDLYRPCDLDFLWSQLRAGTWTEEQSRYCLRFVDGVERDQVAERVFDEPYDEPHGPTTAQRESELILPRRVRLARAAEFAPTGLLAGASFLNGFCSGGPLDAIVFFTIPMLLTGAALGARRVVVRRGYLAVERLFTRLVYRHFTNGGVDDNSGGPVRIMLIGHGLVTLLWAGQGLGWKRPERLRASVLIDTAYGDDCYAHIPGWGFVERSWIRWRVVTWPILIAVVPVLSFVGSWLREVTSS